jgi:two-component system, NarL family, nitrate/nitrite response regulator NarL
LADFARQTRSIRVVIANGEPFFGDGVGRAIRQCSRFQLVGEAAHGREALAMLRTLKPDVAVLGPSLVGLDAHRLLSLTLIEDLATRLVFIGDEVDQAAAYDLLGDGAAGFLTKATNPDQLRDAIVTVAAGGVFLPEETQAAIAREIRLRVRLDQPVLSPREHEVLRRIAEGESVPTIAGATHLSVSTVKTHVHHLYEKLEVSDRAAAVAVAMRRGLLA